MSILSVFARRVVILAMAATAASCGWPRDNPLDPGRCDPRCPAGQVCVEGACVDRDGGKGDATPDRAVADLGDAGTTDARQDAAVFDGLRPDAQGPDARLPDGPRPDASQPPPCVRGWQAVSTGTTADLHGVWGAGPSDVFMVGAGGKVLRYDGTKVHDISPKPAVSATLRAVWGSAKSNVYVVGDSGTLLRYSGSSWTDLSTKSGTTAGIADIWGSAASDIYMVAGSSVIRFDGSKASVVASNAAVGTLAAVWGSGASDIYAAGASPAAAMFRYKGAGWVTAVLDGNWQVAAIWGSGAADVYMVGHTMGGKGGPLIARYGGSSFSAVSLTSTADLLGVCGAHRGVVYAVGKSGSILRSEGTAWTTVASPTTRQLSDVWVGQEGMVAVGLGGTAVHYAFPWKVVRTFSGSSATSLRAVGGSGPGDVYVAGTNGALFRGSGATWSQVKYGAGATYTGIWAWSASDVHVLGTQASGAIGWHYDGNVWLNSALGARPLVDIDGSAAGFVMAVGGTGGYCTAVTYTGTWGTPKLLGTNCNALYGVWTSSSKGAVAVGEPAGMVQHFDGTSWSSVKSNAAATLRGVWGSAPSNVFAVGDQGTVVRYNGSAWAKQTSGTGHDLYGVWGVGAASVFAVGEHSLVLHRTVAGWEATPVGASVTLRAVWGTSDTDVYAVGDDTVLHWCGAP